MWSGKKVFNCVFLSCHIRLLDWVYTTRRCFNVKEIFAPNRRSIWHLSNCNKNRSHNRLVCKRAPTIKLHLPFPCKYWTSTRLEGIIIRKTLTLPRHKDIILNSWSKQEKNGTHQFLVELTFEWYEGTMVFRIFVLFFV